MKQNYEGKDLQSLVELGRQGYQIFDQVNDFLPQDVSSPTDLRSALESFQDMDIKILADVPADGTEGELERLAKARADEQTISDVVLQELARVFYGYRTVRFGAEVGCAERRPLVIRASKPRSGVVRHRA